MNIDDVLTVAVLGFVGFRLLNALKVAASGDGRARVLRIVRGVSWPHVWPIPFVLAAVLAAAVALTSVPGLDWGWWTAIGGTGNPVTGGSDRTAGTVFEWLVPLVFLAMLIPALPLFAEAEERMFRLGAEGWSARRRTWMAVKFGLVHALIGIPIGVALALSVAGAYFQYVYLRNFRRTGSPSAAMMESTRAHAAYNAAIMLVVLAVVVTTAWS